MLKQGLQQKLLQKLSPQQIQFIKLLQLNTTDLLQRVEEELMENPALVAGADGDADEEIVGDNTAEKEVKETEVGEQEDSVSVEDYLTDDSIDVKEYVNDDYDSDGFHLSDEGPDDHEGDGHDQPFSAL